MLLEILRMNYVKMEICLKQDSSLRYHGRRQNMWYYCYHRILIIPSSFERI